MKVFTLKCFPKTNQRQKHLCQNVELIPQPKENKNMKINTKKNTSVYVLSEDQMARLDELISELQSVYCDIYSNRELSVEKVLGKMPMMAALTAVIKDQFSFEDLN